MTEIWVFGYSPDVTDSSVKSNVWKLYFLRMGSGFVLYFPILVLFLQRQGLSYRQIFLYHGLSTLVNAAWQIPSGYLADRWSRRGAIITGCFLSIVGLFCYCLWPTFGGFLLGGAIVSTGFSFLSGTLEALTFESLVALGRAGEFRRAMGMQNFLRFSAEMIASVLGGFLALKSLFLPFWATLIPFTAMLGVACLLQEPPRQKAQQVAGHLSELWRITRFALWRQTTIRNIILFNSFLSAFCLSLYFFSQPYQEFVELPFALFGASHAIVVGLGGLASAYTYIVERHVKDNVFLGLLALAAVVSYLALGSISSLWGLVFIVVTRVAWGFLIPLTFDLVNRVTPSDMRATVLSIKSMGGQILWSILPLSFGFIADRTTLQTALTAAGIIGAIVLVPLYVFLLLQWKRKPY